MAKRKMVSGSVRVRFIKPHMVRNPLYGRRSGPDVKSFVCIDEGAERELPRAMADKLVSSGTCQYLMETGGADGD